MYPVAAIRDAVEQAISTDSLNAVAWKTTDPNVLLGLALMAQAGNPVRKEFSTAAVQAKADFAPVAALLPLMLDGVDESGISELIRLDPHNALGHYLRGSLFHQSNHDSEALASFREAGRCAELRLYDATTANAIFKTVDALELKGEDRLCALSWMAARMSNFSSSALQPLRNSLHEMAKNSDVPTRKELSDLLLILAGHLFGTNYVNRWYGERALEAAFQLKAEVAAAENSLTMYGYGATGQAIFNTVCSWPGLENLPKPQQLAMFLPSRIHRAFAMVDPAKFNSCYVGELNFHVTDSNRGAFEQAKQKVTSTARALLDLALTDPDAVIGAYLRGATSQRDGRHPWFPPATGVGKLFHEKPALLRAAAAHEEATSALWEIGKDDPDRLNISRMMKIGWALNSYAYAHEGAYPPDLDVLVKERHLDAATETNSVITGKPYIYLGAGQKRPANSLPKSQMILLYDDHAGEGGYHQCVLASCIGSAARLETIQEQLRKRASIS
jgi:hypothetical protein